MLLLSPLPPRNELLLLLLPLVPIAPPLPAVIVAELLDNGDDARGGLWWYRRKDSKEAEEDRSLGKGNGSGGTGVECSDDDVVVSVDGWERGRSLLSRWSWWDGAAAVVVVGFNTEAATECCD